MNNIVMPCHALGSSSSKILEHHQSTSVVITTLSTGHTAQTLLVKARNLLQIVLQVICGGPKQPTLLARWALAHVLAVAQACHRLRVAATHDG